MPSSKYKTPEQVNPQSLGDYLDVMSKAIFQTGMSWRVVENKWPGTREVFHNFDAERVASMSLDEIDAIAEDTRVIRNRRKIEAIVSNAVKMVELAEQHGSFKSYLGSHGGFEGTVAALRKGVQVPWRYGSVLYAVRGRRGGALARGVDGVEGEVGVRLSKYGSPPSQSSPIKGEEVLQGLSARAWPFDRLRMSRNGPPHPAPGCPPARA